MSAAQPPIYGIDVITDAVGTSIDAAHNRIVAVGLSMTTATELFDGPEADLLALLDERLDSLSPGVVATYNGSLLHLPLIARRARRRGVKINLRLRADRREAPESPLSDLDHAVCGAWGPHQHLDLRRVYDEGRRPKRGRFDPEMLVPAANELTERDPCRDATLARRLSERRWNQAKKFVDRMPVPAGAPRRHLFDANPAFDRRDQPMAATGTGGAAELRRRSSDS